MHGNLQFDRLDILPPHDACYEYYIIAPLPMGLAGMKWEGQGRAHCPLLFSEDKMPD